MLARGEGAKKPATGFEPFSLRGVLILTALYGVVHSLIRLIAGFQLAMDDPKENIFTQELRWGYLPDNPPLFEWSLTLVQQLTGPGLVSFLIVKYGLLVFSAGFLFLAGRRLFGGDVAGQRWAAITVSSALLLYQIGWNYHQAFTHSLMTIAATCFSFWALIRLLQEKRWADYLIFGASVGLGLMAKYNFAGFLVAVGIPILLDRDMRRTMLHWRIGTSVLLAILILLPHILWLNAHRELLEWYAGVKLGLDGSHWERVGEGLGDALVAILSFYVPFLIIVAIIARKAFTRAAIVSDPLLQLCRRSIIVSIAVILAAVLFLGVSNVTERYVVPFFLPGFFWLMARVRVAVAEKGDGVWVKTLVGAVAVMAVLRVVNVGWAGPPVCDDCWRWIPYDALETAIEEEGFDKAGIYVAYEENTAGNLRRLLPDADVRSMNLLFYNTIDTRADRACYFVWSEELLGQPVQEQFRAVSQAPGTRIVDAPWRHPIRSNGWRSTQWGISPVPEGDSFYNNICTDKPWP